MTTRQSSRTLASDVFESGAGVDVKHLARLSRFVMDQMRVHSLAELCIAACAEVR